MRGGLRIIEGQQLDHRRYRLLNLIPRSNTIYLAEDTEFSRQVAIKVVLPENSAHRSVDTTKAEIIKKFNHRGHFLTSPKAYLLEGDSEL
jgi:hypothetical protein